MVDDPDEPNLSALESWRQGDCSFDLRSSLIADVVSTENPGEPFTPYENQNFSGIVLISQTCDVVRIDDPQAPVVVAPVLKIGASEFRHTSRHAKPCFAVIPALADQMLVADLSQSFSITGKLLAQLERTPGYAEVIDGIKFARAIERMFGRYAFPNGFEKTTERLRSRCLSRYAKPESNVGKVYRSLREIRVRAEPSWNEPNAQISFIFVLNDKQEASFEDIQEEVVSEVSKMTLPESFVWSDPPYVLDGADALSARDILDSQPLDIHSVSGPV